MSACQKRKTAQKSPKKPHICKIADRTGRYDSVVGMFALQVSVSCSRVVEPRAADCCGDTVGSDPEVCAAPPGEPAWPPGS